MKGYMTKYALTQGIVEVETGHYGEELPRDNGVTYRYTKAPGVGNGTIQLVDGRDFFADRDAAEADARRRARRKVASLEKSLAKMRRLAESPKWAKS